MTLAATNPGVQASTPALSAPTAGRAPGIVNDWKINVGERPTSARPSHNPLPPFPWVTPDQYLTFTSSYSEVQVG